MRISDWGSDVCSSYLVVQVAVVGAAVAEPGPGHAVAGHRPDVGFGAAFARHRFDAQRRQCGGDLVEGGLLAGMRAGIEAVDPSCAAVALGHPEVSQVGTECVLTGESRWRPTKKK